MRQHSKAYALFVALFAIVAIHVTGHGSGTVFTPQPLSETAAETKLFIAPGRSEPGYRDRDFQARAASLRRDAQGAGSDKYATISAAARTEHTRRIIGVSPRTAAVLVPSAQRRWNWPRAPPPAA